MLLGAGLDTFALRNPHPGLKVFEVDHPATQRWKQRLLHEAGLEVPQGCTHVPVDFETQNLRHRLHEAGLDSRRPALFAMLGVVPYLTQEAFASTLAAVEQHGARTGLVLDYALPRQDLPPLEQLAFDSLAGRVADAGEPFRLFFTDTQVAAHLRTAQMSVRLQLGPAQINELFFAGRGSRLRVLGSGARLVSAFR